MGLKKLHKAELISGDGQACEDMSDLRTGFEEMHGNLNLTDTKEFPKAAFGRGAKKRQRKSYKTGEFEALDPVAAKNERAQAEEGDSPAVSSELGTREGTGSITISQEKKEQLRTVLPTIVNEKQVNDLLLKANGDLDLAVALYFEGSQNDHQEQASDKSASRALIDDKDLVVTIGVEGGISKREVLQIKGSLIAKTTSPLAAKRRRGSQSSILTFFNKSNSNANCSVSADSSSSLHIEPALFKNKGQNKATLSFSSPIKISGVDQIMANLGESMALDKAQTLLQQSCGDVNAALDLYYKANCSSLPSQNSADGTLSKCNDKPEWKNKSFIHSLPLKK
ncbi:hypothetical protein L7F22_002095 [Adiantum nelumboides]|nr:hypothetical protein [Adiantum nelumboides]